MRTRDHSFVEQRNAAVTRIEHLNRNILFSCLGSTVKPVFDITGPIRLMQGDKLLLCSDGLWGSLSDDEIVRQLASRPVADAVPDLVESALRVAGETSDNVTVLAIEWETPDIFESSQVVIADSMMDGEFATTIQTGLLETTTDELDEAGIERSIAEINDAIRRSGTKKA